MKRNEIIQNGNMWIGSLFATGGILSLVSKDFLVGVLYVVIAALFYTEPSHREKKSIKSKKTILMIALILLAVILLFVQGISGIMKGK